MCALAGEQELDGDDGGCFRGQRTKSETKISAEAGQVLRLAPPVYKSTPHILEESNSCLPALTISGDISKSRHLPPDMQKF